MNEGLMAIPTPTQSIVREVDSPSGIGIVGDDEDASVMVQKIAAYFKIATESTLTASPTAAADNTSTVRSLTRRAEDAETEVIRLRAINDSLCAQIESMKKEKLSISTIMQNTSIISGKGDSVDKEEYDRLQSEYNAVLHSLLTVKREAAQLRSELLFVNNQSIVATVPIERESHRLHSEELTALRDRIEFIKKDHTHQLDKMNRIFDNERKQFHTKLTQMVSSSEVDTLRGLLRDTQQQLTSVTQSRDELIDLNKDAVSISTLQAAESEQCRRAEQVESLLEELTREKTIRTKIQEAYQSMAFKLEDANKSISKINQSRGDSEAAIQQVTHQLDSKTVEYQELRDRYELVQSYRKEYEESNRSLQEKVSDLNAEEIKTRILIDNLTADNSTMATALKDQKEQLVSCKSVMSTQQQKLDILKRDIDEKSTIAATHRQEFTIAITESQQQLRTSTEEANQLRISIQDRDSNISSLRHSLKQEQHRVEEIKSLEEGILLLQEKQKSLEGTISSKTSMLKLKSQNLKKTEDELSNYKVCVFFFNIFFFAYNKYCKNEKECSRFSFVHKRKLTKCRKQTSQEFDWSTVEVPNIPKGRIRQR